MKNFEDFLNEELFDSTPYDVKINTNPKYNIPDSYSYEFYTVKGYKIYVNLILNKENRQLNIGFSVDGYKGIDMVGNFETNRIFTTLKTLLDKHEEEFDTIRTYSDQKRIKVYKELYKRIGYEIIYSTPTEVIAEKQKRSKN